MVALLRCVVVANQFPQNGSTCGNNGEHCLLAILLVRSRPVSVVNRVISNCVGYRELACLNYTCYVYLISFGSVTMSSIWPHWLAISKYLKVSPNGETWSGSGKYPEIPPKFL